jgi:hypothetical protein
MTRWRGNSRRRVFFAGAHQGERASWCRQIGAHEHRGAPALRGMPSISSAPVTIPAKANAPCSPPSHELSNCCPIRRGSAKRRRERIIDALIASYRHSRLPGSRCCAFDMFHKAVTAVRQKYLSLPVAAAASYTETERAKGNNLPCQTVVHQSLRASRHLPRTALQRATSCSSRPSESRFLISTASQ